MTASPLRLLLLAPPGAGKGAQGKRLAEIFGVPHLETGEMLRAEVAEGTPLGREAEGFMDRGELVPDEVVIDLVLDRVAGDGLEGFVLDGFPRTLTQATTAYDWGLANGRTFHAVVFLDVPEDELVQRLTGRGEREGRRDDTEDTIRRRLVVYQRETTPLLDYYRQRGILLPVDGIGSVEEVTDRIRAAVDGLG